MLFGIVVIIISFFVGFAMKRGGLCTYAAAVQVVNDRRIERMMVFLGVAAWATVIILPLHWFYPSLFALSSIHHNLALALIGGTVLGLGAFFNRGCFFGTFVALVSGNTNYIATLLGLSTGVAITHFYFIDIVPTTLSVSAISEAGQSSYIWLIVMVAFALFMLFSIKLKEENVVKKRAGLEILSWQSIASMIVIGLGGAVLYATVSGWNYADALANSTLGVINTESMGASTLALLCTLAMSIGGISAVVILKEFHLTPINFRLLSGCFIGGTLMGIAAMLVPGGNDGFLLKGLPALAPHALVGFGSMIVVMIVLVYLFRNEKSPRF